MSVGDPQRVICHNRRLLLVDVPGINDHATAKSLAAGKSAIDYNLEILRGRLNDGCSYVVFFVIEPHLTGTIRDEDLALIKLIFASVEYGPQIGLIMTLIPNACMAAVTAPRFVLMSLQQAGIETRFFATENHLFLRKHSVTFNDTELLDIQKYILSFEPRQVHIRELPTVGLSFQVTIRPPLVVTSLPQIQRAPSVRMNIKSSATTREEFVIFFGGKGVGKSALHIALDEKERRYSWTPWELIECGGRTLKLLDVIGVGDFREKTGIPGIPSELLPDFWSPFSSDDICAVFIVLVPRNGRLDPGDFAAIGTLLEQMRAADTDVLKGKRNQVVGIILNQVPEKDLRYYEDPDYIFSLFGEMGISNGFLSHRRVLVLPEHEGDFSQDEVRKIRNYVLSAFKWVDDTNSEVNMIHSYTQSSRKQRFFGKLNPFK